MKKYILIMGLMTCMCLMATSCKSEDEDGVSILVIGLCLERRQTVV